MNIILPKLDESSKIPLYYQITSQLLDQIERGELMPGDSLPSERELCELYNVSRGTMRQAIRALVEKGYLRRKQGKGTVVTPPTLHHDLIGDFSFGIGIMRQKMSLRSKVLSIDTMTGRKSIVRRLKIENKAKLIRLYRIRYANDEPWIIEDSYLPKNYFPDLEKFDFSKELLADILAKHYYTRLGRVQAYIEPTIASKNQASILNVNVGAPALVLDRVLLSEDNKPVIYSNAFVRGDRCRYYFNTIDKNYFRN